MARVTFSALIAGARNKVGDIVFSVWKGIPYVRIRVIPANPQTVAQTAQRLTFQQCVPVWQSLLGEPGHQVKVNWNRFAEGYALSGFNRFMSIGSKEEAAGNLETITPYNELVPQIIDLAGVAGASGVITVTWTAAGLPALSTIRFWYRLPEELDIHYHGAAAVADETYDLDNVTAGTEFCVYVFVQDTTQDYKNMHGQNDMVTSLSGA